MCVNRPPVCSAGPELSVPPGSLVTVNGSAMDPDGDPVTIRWTQSAGDMVVLDKADTAQPSFTAPDAKEPKQITLSMVCSDGKLESPASLVTITVDPTLNAPSSSCNCRVAGRGAGTMPAGALLLFAGLLGLRLRRRLRMRD
jgi:hypothetical protein